MPPTNAEEEKRMTTQTNVGAERSGKKAGAFAVAAITCLLWPSVSPAAEPLPYQLYKNGSCTAAKICSIDFPAVPAGRSLEISNVSCYLRVDGASVLNAMQFLLMEGAAVKSALTVEPRLIGGSAATSLVYAANHHVLMFVSAGRRLQAYADLTQGTYSQFACHISGRMA
jgi:hypothetical protein